MSRDQGALVDAEGLGAPRTRWSEALGYNTMNSHREPKRDLSVSEECWRAVKEVESLIASLGAISGGLADTIISTVATITSYLAAVLSLWNLMMQQQAQGQQAGAQVVIFFVTAVGLIIALIVAYSVGSELRKIAPFKEVKASRGAIRELLDNRRRAIEKCLEECRKAIHAGDGGELVLCSDTESLSKALNEILGTPSPRLLGHFLGQVRAWLRRLVGAWSPCSPRGR